MPPQRTRRRQLRRHRSRTSSQSSNDMQCDVRTETSIVSQQSFSSHPILVKPGKEFLRVLKTVNANGCHYAGDEVFSLKQLCQYVIEYIRKKELYDPVNPLVVYCRDDPLGSVFGVEKFSRNEALKHIMSHCDRYFPHMALPNSPVSQTSTVDIVPSPMFEEPSPVPEGRETAAAAVNGASGNSASAETSNMDIPATGGAACSYSKLRKRRRRRNRRSRSSPLSGMSSSSPSLTSAPNLHSRYSQPSTSLSQTQRVRRVTESSLPLQQSRHRQSSFSILYTSDDGLNGRSLPWALTFELLDSGEESVLSVQSKETALVHSSTDDLWFLTDDDENSRTSISIAIDTVEFHNAEIDPPFAEEYEVEDDNDEPETAHGVDTDGSHSPFEEIFVVYNESDVDFWADSESSDFDSDNTTDDELFEEDKWKCGSCESLNNPVRRYCDKCWAVRPDWLTENRLHTNKSESGQNYDDLGTKKESFDNLRNNDEFHLDDDVIIECEQNSLLKRVESLDTLPASEISDIEFDMMNSKSGLVKISADSGLGSSINSTSGIEVTDAGSLFSSSQESQNSRAAENRSSTPLEVTQAFKSSNYMVFHSKNLDRSEEVRASGIVDTNDTVSADAVSSTTVLAPSTCVLTLSTDVAFSNVCSQSSTRTMSDGLISKNTKLPSSVVQKNKKYYNVDFNTHSPDSSIKVVRDKLNVSSSSSQELCLVCMVKPKEASIIHGKTGHQVCCYVCAKRLKRRGKPCPVCRRRIQKVVKNYLV